MKKLWRKILSFFSTKKRNENELIELEAERGRLTNVVDYLMSKEQDLFEKITEKKTKILKLRAKIQELEIKRSRIKSDINMTKNEEWLYQ